MPTLKTTIDANEATASIAHKVSEVIAIYPITPASPMGEWSDEWSMAGKKNIWGEVPEVIELQSEGGAAGTMHGALQTGALTTTFTASQGLLLMMPNLFKIAGELTPAVVHVAARSVATHALSIFGDHSDVMAVRMTGMAMLASGSVQEAMDMALIAHASTLETRIPFLHFFDGFRTSHEVQKIQPVSESVIRKMIRDEWVIAHRNRALKPDKPVLRGTAQNPDVFFQARETVNPFYSDCPERVQNVMDAFASHTERSYRIFEYHGAPDAEQVVILMGSGAETVHETIDKLNAEGRKTGVVKVRLFRPFSMRHLVESLPDSVRAIAVLDRTKEPGSTGEPLYNDVVTSLQENRVEKWITFHEEPTVINGRYGLSSKEFTPPMVERVIDELAALSPKRRFTIGINDDVSHTSLDYESTTWESETDVFEGLFYGLGADGTVSANKNSIKIIGDHTDYYAQGYFVYDSKKSGARTVSHLRFGERPIRSAYLINKANFIACHQYSFLARFDMLKHARQKATFLLNAPYAPDDVWDHLPTDVQRQIIEKEIQLYAIDAYKVARENGMGTRINTVMQTCFFAISDILPKDEAIRLIKEAIQHAYGNKGAKLLQSNYAAVDNSIENLFQVDVPDRVTSDVKMRPAVPLEAPDFVQNVIAEIIAGNGDQLPVSAFEADGTFQTGTTKWEKRSIAQNIPVLESDICIQCGKCSFVCPHAVIRMKAYDGTLLEASPETFKFMDARGREWPENTKVSIQVSPEDCTGCELCVEICPAKDRTEVGRKALNMASIEPILDQERENWDFFLTIPEYDRSELKVESVKGSQFLQPLFEFSGACAGCGETPYIKLITQLYGDRMVIANATGCSSIYGGNLPTTPYTTNQQGLGPAWSNSLFEDRRAPSRGT